MSVTASVQPSPDRQPSVASDFFPATYRVEQTADVGVNVAATPVMSPTLADTSTGGNSTAFPQQSPLNNAPESVASASDMLEPVPAYPFQDSW